MGMRMNNITKIYEKKTQNHIAIEKISLSIDHGEMVSIMGKSGAGKSTLLHILGLLDMATDGKYELDGRNVETLKNTEIAKLRNRKIGFILQDFGLIEEETALNNVILPLMFGDAKLKEMQIIAMDKLTKVGMKKYAHKAVAELSGGERQRVAIARALVTDPDYILADEPTGALDSVNAEKVIDILDKLHEEGKTLIIVTHDRSIADRCKRQIVIEDGRIVSDIS